jgi:arginyl-tRNA--protein-N-Asp/Glu arginylyltransferase
VSLRHNPSHTNEQIIKSSNSRNNLLKEDKLYALSNISCGFFTETEANVDLFRYWWKLKEHMNSYFMKRYLRRDPVKFEFAYKLKCHGCSRCLDETLLKRELEDLTSSKTASSANSNSTLLRLFYNKLVSVVPKSKEDPLVISKREKRKKEIKT